MEMKITSLKKIHNFNLKIFKKQFKSAHFFSVQKKNKKKQLSVKCIKW